MRTGSLASRERSAGRGFYVLAAAAGGLAMAASGMALVLSVWLLPSLFSFWIERQAGRPMTRTMALFGLAVALPALAGLWAAGGGLAVGLALLIDPIPTGCCWSAQAAAWLLAELLPALLILQANVRGRRELSHLRKSREQLDQEWPVS